VWSVTIGINVDGVEEINGNKCFCSVPRNSKATSWMGNFRSQQVKAQTSFNTWKVLLNPELEMPLSVLLQSSTSLSLPKRITAER